MAETTVKLIPSTYTTSNASYVVVSNASNMYTDTSSTTYASIRGRNSSSYTYYCNIGGFNFSSIPSDAYVYSFTIRVKASRNSYESTNSSYRLRLGPAPYTSTGGSYMSETVLPSSLTTTATTYTFTCNSTWSTIKRYGDNFCIQVPLRSTGSSYPYVYIYGAEIEVTYGEPKTVTVSTNESDISYYTYPSDGKLTGSYAQVYIKGNLNDIVATDNGVDITSSLTYDDDDGLYINDYYYYEMGSSQMGTDHNIVISHSSPQTTYVVTASTTESDWTVGTSADEYNGIVGAGRGCMVYIDADTLNVQCIDNNIDVTSSLIYVPEQTWGNYVQPAYFYYTISNISENHTVIVSRSNTPSVCAISATSTCDAIYYVYAGNSSSGTTYIGIGGSCEIMFSGYKNTPSTGFVVTDNNIDVSNSLVYNNDDTGYYTYTITNIQSDHNVVISYTGETYKITTRSSDTSRFCTGVNYYTGSNNSPYPNEEEITVFAGDNLICYVYWGTSSSWNGYPSNMHILDNDVDVTNLFSSATSNDGNRLYYYEYLSNISSDHTILVYAGDVYIRVISTDPTLYSDIYRGNSHNMTDFRGVTIGSNCGIDIYNTDAQSTDFLQDVIATDNGVNINNLLVYYTATGEGGASAYYVFTLNNIQTSHTIVLSSSKNIIYLKSNGSWLQTTKVYKKSNNAWVEQSDYSSLFSNNDIWIKV